MRGDQPSIIANRKQRAVRADTERIENLHTAICSMARAVLTIHRHESTPAKVWLHRLRRAGIISAGQISIHPSAGTELA